MVAIAVLIAASLAAQSAPALPATIGERLSGGRIQLAQALAGQPAILVASFSRESSASSMEWLQTLHADPAFVRFSIWQVVQLQRAPGLVRPLIRAGLRRQTPVSWQANTIVILQDEIAWRDWFHTSIETEPSVVALDGTGKVVWSGTGSSAALAAKLKAALR